MDLNTLVLMNELPIKDVAAICEMYNVTLVISDGVISEYIIED